MAVIKMTKAQQVETEIAVLQVQVTNIETKINDIKEGLKQVHDCIHINSEETQRLIKELQESNEKSHKALGEKVTALEKWRWMLMGAGVVIGSMGFESVAKLLK
jgi:polyhydroxyalkanoate synthesis regulator phasin